MKTQDNLRQCCVVVLAVLLLLVIATPASQAAANRNVWIEDPVNTQSSDQDYITCLGSTVGFQATKSGVTGTTWIWTGAQITSHPTNVPSTATKTFTEAGNKTVTAEYAGVVSYAARVKVLEVASATANDGTEVDDGDGNPNTKMYFVCKGAGSVTITATCNPAMTEQQLQGTCWSTSGGTGEALLTRTVSKASCTDQTITFTAGTSTRSVRIVVLEVASASANDGTLIDDGDANPNTSTYVVCRASSGIVTVTASPCPSDPPVNETRLAATSCWTTTGGSGTAKLTRTVSKTTAGSTTVTFTAGTSTKSVTVKVIEVATATANDGSEVDDGDGNANTKMYFVCKGAGSVTVTATCNPAMTESQLQGTCWGTAGGTGTALLTRTVSKASCTDQTVTFSAGVTTKSVRVVVVEVASASANDGTLIDDGDGNPNTSTYVVCLASSGVVTVSAAPCLTDPPVNEARLAATACWTTTGGTGTAKLTRTVSKTAAGTTTVTFTAGSSTKAVTVKVLEVASATPSEGTEVDDGDGNANTKTYIVYKGTGNVTVTAASYPAMTEQQLQGTCWTTTMSGAMAGTAKLTRTISKASPASGTVTFQAGTSLKSVTVYVVEIAMITPAGDPIASPVDVGDGQNEFTFNAASPGVLTMSLKASVAPSGCANLVKLASYFTVGSIGNSSMAWAPANPSGTPSAVSDTLVASVTFTGLPAAYSDFGAKKAAIYSAGSKRDEENYEVFFPKAESNRPSGTPAGPNWFYYWRQTTANKANTTMEYLAGARSYYDYLNGRKIVLRDDASGTQIAAWGTPKGIDCFAWTTAHEAKHHTQLTGFWPTSYDSANDGDVDWLPNSQETTYMPGRNYSPTNANTFQDTIGYGQNPIPDVEDICMRAQVSPYNLDALWTNGSANSQDWANPGKNSKTVY